MNYKAFIRQSLLLFAMIPTGFLAALGVIFYLMTMEGYVPALAESGFLLLMGSIALGAGVFLFSYIYFGSRAETLKKERDAVKRVLKFRNLLLVRTALFDMAGIWIAVFSYLSGRMDIFVIALIYIPLVFSSLTYLPKIKNLLNLTDQEIKAMTISNSTDSNSFH
jgi:hypothetical protein